jgi:Cu+-exporting ATPase
MIRFSGLSLALCAVICFAFNAAQASDAKETIISVPDMHCGGCAKKLSTEMSKVAGVLKVETDLEAKTIKVTPKAQGNMSPKSLWEAVENAGKKPTKLEGPNGSFTTKPTK